MSKNSKGTSSSHEPLASRERPAKWRDVANLPRAAVEIFENLEKGGNFLPSLILWGPPGVGKTTTAKLLGALACLDYHELSAVLSGVKEVKEIATAAQSAGKPVLLFIDEIHRFNKSQQDALLPFIENGSIVFIGATTENPSFYVNGALLSRCKLIIFDRLREEDLGSILDRTLKHGELAIADEVKELLVHHAFGDGRRVLNLLENLLEKFGAEQLRRLDAPTVADLLKGDQFFAYDKSGDAHYQLISAFIKSLRGSNPEAALYWGIRIVESGEDPRFLIRRMMIFASEDIGNADPRALQIAVATAESFDRIGLPEGRIIIAHCITYLATAPKSNRSYVALNQALASIKKHPTAEVPVHLRNAPTKMMQSIGYGAEYRYPHDYEKGFIADERYLPDDVKGEIKYEPSDRGYEKTIKERQEWLRQRAVGRTGS